MCGILAILLSGLSEEELRARALKLSKKLRHRGPDWSGIHAQHYQKKNTNVVLAHERLAIVDILSGEQPLLNKSGTVALCVNGEIYNYQSIRGKLEAELGNDLYLATNSDCEPIIPLYEKNRTDDFLNELDGMFAFIISDEENELFIASRDPIGICSLYYGWGDDGSIYFSSELKALEGICPRYEEFPPGFSYNSKREQPLLRYYNPIWVDEKYLPTAPLELTDLRNVLEKAIVKMLMCDVPYGVLLSGGLDSSLVASIASRHAAKRIEDQERSDAWFPRLHSFSIGLKGSPDLANAKVVADFLGTVHHEWTFTPQQGIDALRDVIYHLETYDITTIRASTPMYLLSRRIKAMGIKMVLSGEGADEVFGGYLYFHKAPNPEEFHKETVRKMKALHYYDCLRANKSPLAWGVEGRFPFLDNDLLSLAMNIDPLFKTIIHDSEDPRRGIEKYILRKAFDTPDRPYLPDSVLWRQKEQFSDGVGYNWIDSLKAFAETQVTDAQLESAVHRYPYNTPATKEGYFYRTIFASFYSSDSAQVTFYKLLLN